MPVAAYKPAWSQRVTSLAAAGLVLAAVLGSTKPAEAATKLQVAYLPILPMAQLFVMEGEGWAKEAGLELELTRFSSGPAVVQALASGKFEVAYVGIGPALVARAGSVDLQVVAANGVEQVALIGRGPFAGTFAKAASPAAAFAEFRKTSGRAAKIATLPKGSVPHTVLQHYLSKVAAVPETDYELLGVGEDRVQQALLSGAVEAASILEPILTIVQQRDATARILATGGQMFPNQPGAVLSVRERLIKANPDAVRTLVELHARATELIKSDPERAARHVHQAIGRGLVEPETILAALKSPMMKPIADPKAIIEATRRMQEFQADIGALSQPVAIEALFNTTFYDAARPR